MPQRPPFPFIVASGRSGTTLLQAMLNAGPQLAIPPEAPFLVPVASMVRFREGELDLDHLAQVLQRRRSLRLWQLRWDAVRSRLLEERPPDYPEAIRTLYALYSQERGKPRYGDKTPQHVLSLPFLAASFPEARFIHLIRDGRDVTASFIARGLGPRDVVEGAMRWKRAVATGRADGARLGSDRYREVRYEALVADPEATLREVCSSIDIDYDPAMLDFGRDEVDRMLPRDDLRALHENLYRPLTPHLRDWRRELRPHEVAMFEALTGDLLSELGYERSVPHPSVTVRLAARRRWVVVRAERAARRASRAIARSGAAR